MSGLRILIVGVGSIGERHLRCFGNTGRATMSVCEVNESLRNDIAQRYDVTNAYASLNEALRDPPDAAVICTPAHLHIPMALELAEAGAHLLIEKPLSTSLDRIADLAELCANRERIAGVAYVTRCNPVLAGMREAIQSQRFGRPVQLVAVGGQHFPFYRPAYRETYYTDRATGGGAIQDALTHTINAAEWLVGPITQLAADADHQLLEGVEVEDTVHVIARHGTLQASYSLNQHQAPNESSMTVVCERGTVRFESHEQRWRSISEPETPWQDELTVPLQRDELFVRQAEMFLDALEHDKPVACSLADAEQTLRVNLAILQAVESRAWREI